MTMTETMDSRRLAGSAVVAAAVPLALSGCATMRQHEAANTEDLLAASGFQRRQASKPEQHQDLTTMPPYKLVERNKNGDVVYTFADPGNCHCLYVGGPKEFSQYQHLLMDREVAREMDDASLKWEAWGPWWW
jgi:hypothetical protein